MDKYEGLFIVKPNLSKEDSEKVSSSIADVITKHGGKIERKEDMGVKKLAYDIKKESQGYYLLMYFMAETKSISDMRRAYKLNESILRTLIFKG